jgi:hypothetical protein
MWYRQEIKFGVFILSFIIVVIISSLGIVIVLRFAQTAHSHDDNFIFCFTLSRDFTSLSTGYQPSGVGVCRSVFTEIITEDIE